MEKAYTCTCILSPFVPDDTGLPIVPPIVLTGVGALVRTYSACGFTAQSPR